MIDLCSNVTCIPAQATAFVSNYNYYNYIGALFLPVAGLLPIGSNIQTCPTLCQGLHYHSSCLLGWFWDALQYYLLWKVIDNHILSRLIIISDVDTTDMQ